MYIAPGSSRDDTFNALCEQVDASYTQTKRSQFGVFPLSKEELLEALRPLARSFVRPLLFLFLDVLFTFFLLGRNCRQVPRPSRS